MMNKIENTKRINNLNVRLWQWGVYAGVLSLLFPIPAVADNPYNVTPRAEKRLEIQTWGFGRGKVELRQELRRRKGAAKTMIVTNTDDATSGSLRHAIAIASNGDTISITAKGMITLTGGELLIDKSLTIRGPGATKLTISGNNTNRVFRITPNTTVAISGLTISNGRAEGGTFPDNAGGGILNDHANLTVTGCRIVSNTAVFGGGIFSNSLGFGSARLTVLDTVLTGNSADFAGGGIFAGGGFLSPANSGDANTTMINSSVNDNNAAYYGGGIFNDGFKGAALFELSNSVVTNNVVSQSSQAGGGVYNNGDSGVANMSLNHSAVSGNSATYGAGIFNDGGGTLSPGNATLIIDDSAVSGNSTIDHSGIGGTGGGINNLSFSGGNAVLTVRNSSVNENAGEGGGIYTDSQAGNSQATIIGSEVNDNTGGGLYNHQRDGSSILSVIDSVVNGNIDNGGVVGNQGTISVVRSSILGNAGTFGRAGGISSNEGMLTVTDSSIDGNSGDTVGAIAVGCAGSAVIRNSSISNNYQSDSIFSGAGWRAIANGCTSLTLINSTVSGNRAEFSDFVMAIANLGSLSIMNSTISGNRGISIYSSIIDPDVPATVEIANTIINADPTGQSIRNVSSNSLIVSHGYNLSSDAASGHLTGPGDMVNTDPRLGPLKNNGGPTLTHALLVGSPAINAGDPNFNPFAFDPPFLYDQRSGPRFPRVVNGRIDIGAVESRRR